MTDDTACPARWTRPARSWRVKRTVNVSGNEAAGLFCCQSVKFSLSRRQVLRLETARRYSCRRWNFDLMRRQGHGLVSALQTPGIALRCVRRAWASPRGTRLVIGATAYIMLGRSSHDVAET